MTHYHLGIYMGHDTGVAIVDEQLNILWVFEEERFNGEKMTYFNPYFSLKEVLKLDLRHFRSISFGFNPDEGEADFLKKFVRFQKVRAAEVLRYLSSRIGWDEVRYVGHHDAHAAGAFFPSGFDDALILVADGTGESESTSLYAGEGREISRISSELTNDFSLGILYQYFTEWLGYRSHNTSQHCGKIMGLASYGSPVYTDRIRALLEENGPDYRWPGGSLLKMRGKMAEAFGPPQPRPVNEFSRLQADVAASIQTLLEEIVVERLKRVQSSRPFKNLCFSGGVAMNSQLNYQILKSEVCENLFVQPLASDRGIALGAALASAAGVGSRKSEVGSRKSEGGGQGSEAGRKQGAGSRERGVTSSQCPVPPSINTHPVSSIQHPAGIYLGYGEGDPHGELERLIQAYDFPIFIEHEDISPREVASLLDNHEIIALFQGRQEVGPRALGNRSILAAPTREARDRTNRIVKYREPWRPFAPTVLEEEVGRFFDINRPEPFMTVIYGVLPEMRKGIEGITHVDGTARLQTVSHHQNPLFYDIIKAYDHVSGIPMVLNTSFNINGQPIVRSVYDAVLTFLCCGIDGLLIENTLVRKTRDLSKDHIHRLDRILFEATRDAAGLVIRVLDYSEETEALLSRVLDCACVKFRRDFGAKPISRCYISGHTKMSWNIISRIEPWVREFVYGETEGSTIEGGEICIIVSGERLIEASSRPTRTYVKFDRNVFRDLIETCAQTPNSDRYFLLDRECHLFDVGYLDSRFRAAEPSDNPVEIPGCRTRVPIAGQGNIQPILSESVHNVPAPVNEQEDMYETLADA
ncbi:MAG: carbamoyltransferase C-terminal domain-containing protein [Candidatus Desulfacyla sp.]